MAVEIRNHYSPQLSNLNRLIGFKRKDLDNIVMLIDPEKVPGWVLICQHPKLFCRVTTNRLAVERQSDITSHFRSQNFGNGDHSSHLKTFISLQKVPRNSGNGGGVPHQYFNPLFSQQANGLRTPGIIQAVDGYHYLILDKLSQLWFALRHKISVLNTKLKTTAFTKIVNLSNHSLSFLIAEVKSKRRTI